MSSFEFRSRVQHPLALLLWAVSLCASSFAHSQSLRQTFLTDEAFVKGETLFWTPAFQKCWDETTRNLGQEELPLKPETKYVKHLNSFEWDYEKTVPKNSHLVIVTGAGKEFRDQANQLLLRHFGRAVPPLDENYFLGLGADHFGPPVNEMIILSILKHDLVFENALVKYDQPFPFYSDDGQVVKAQAFGSFGDNRKLFAGAASVLRYNTEGTEFAISFPSGTKGEELIFVRSDTLQNVQGTIEKVREWRKASAIKHHKVNGIDTILIPSLQIDHYEDMAKYLRGIATLDSGIRVAIARAGQRVQLNLDETGSHMKTAAFIIPPTFLSTGGGAESPVADTAQARNFLFNRPFQVMLWKKDADIPFFFGRIDTSALKLKDP